MFNLVSILLMTELLSVDDFWGRVDVCTVMFRSSLTLRSTFYSSAWGTKSGNTPPFLVCVKPIPLDYKKQRMERKYFQFFAPDIAVVVG